MPDCGESDARRRRPGHRAPPPAHRGRRPARPASSRAAAGAARARGRPLGRRPDARCCCATWRAAGGRARLLLLATFRDTEADVPDALAETLADLRRSDDVVRLRLPASPARRSPSSSAAPAATRTSPELARHDQRRSPAATRSCVCELWRALVDTGVELVDGALAAHAPAGRARHPGERARGRQRAARAAAAGDQRPARARGGRRAGVRARRPARGRRARGRRAPRPRSTRPSAAG